MLKSLDFKGTVWRGTPSWYPKFLLGLVCFPFRKFDLSISKGLKVQNFGGPNRGDPLPGTTDFCRTKVLPGIFDRSDCE